MKTYGPEHTMTFGKYRGWSLDQVAETDPGYVVWLADENVLLIEPEFLDAVRRDAMEDDIQLDPGNRFGAFRND